jgi:Flp pilus assembly protein TadG
VADLVAQTPSVSPSDISNIFAAANQLIYPYPTSGAKIVVSSIVSDGAGNGTVAWSQASTGAALATNAAVAVPTGLMSASSCAKGACSVIFSQVTYGYSSPLGKLFIGTVQMSDYFYAHPRQSTTISISG